MYMYRIYYRPWKMSALTCTLYENNIYASQAIGQPLSCTNLTLHLFCILGDDGGYDLRMVMTMMTWWWPQATARSQAVWPLWFSMKRSAPWPTRNSTHLRWHNVSLCNAMVIFWCCFELGKILLFSHWKRTPSVQFMVCRCEGNALDVQNQSWKTGSLAFWAKRANKTNLLRPDWAA